MTSLDGKDLINNNKTDNENNRTSKRYHLEHRDREGGRPCRPERNLSRLLRGYQDDGRGHQVVGDNAYVQVFDSTRGLKIGEKVEFEGHMLEATLAPGLLSRNYDGLQNDLEKMDGLFIARGSITDPIDFEKKLGVQAAGPSPATRFRPRRGWGRSRRSGSSTRSW